ncbi:unnamed protein product [Acanthoscelides obtectus]|uniref:Uncharacterized protein n=1 Tax=Acanthoscelides obtectus TaxID=200917 RepID=A0A9P0LIZ1_ACAOB|nr:unnamed protein product [Acanthoscelides obtectus]CAK1646475.1 hypothetical protein AOBTE_LOCUS14651 [Acanthoscelides obtectus]
MCAQKRRVRRRTAAPGRHCLTLTVGYSAFKLVFGQEGQTPQIRTVLADLPTPDPIDSTTVQKKMKKNAEEQVSSLNKKHRNNQSFKVGDVVLLSRGQRAEKFTCEFVGPYIIKQLLANDRYSIQKLGTRITLKYSKDQLRHWPIEWTPEDFQNLLELNDYLLAGINEKPNDSAKGRLQ